MSPPVDEPSVRFVLGDYKVFCSQVGSFRKKASADNTGSLNKFA